MFGLRRFLSHTTEMHPLAVLVVLAAFGTAIFLDLRGEQLTGVLVAAIAVAGGLARKR
jgi:hypothetical protein